MRRARTIVAAVAVVLGAIGAIAVRGYRRAWACTHPPRSHVTAADEAAARKELPGLEAASFRTSDGLTLRGWFAGGSNGAAIVFVHGGGNNRTALLPEAELLVHHGYSALVYDTRASGESDGELMTGGDREKYDLAAAIDYVSSRPGVDPGRIGVVGFSIGASTAALEAATDRRARAVVLYATWSSMRDELKSSSGRFGPLTWGPLLFGLRREGVDVDAVDPIDHVAEIAPRPLLMVAGTEDLGHSGTRHAARLRGGEGAEGALDRARREPRGLPAGVTGRVRAARRRVLQSQPRALTARSGAAPPRSPARGCG